jgi:peptidoglycan/LPS O-acetylase OafA/YrhL
MIRSTENLSTLDFMRALSTLVVIGVHYLGMTGRFPWGMGALPRVVVLMFFVHTGFVLMISLERQQNTCSHHLWRRFMLRRLFRVYPLTTCVLAVIVLWRIPSQIVAAHFEYLQLGTVAIISNFLLTMNLTASPSLLSPLWSLPYEFQLYLLLPSLFALVNRWRSAAPVVGVCCIIVVLALAQPLVPHAGRLDILEFAPCITAGILSYQLSKTVLPRWPFAVWPVLLGAIMFLGFLARDSYYWPLAWSACFLTAVAAPAIRQARSEFVIGVSRWIAQHSYAIYLTHYGCLWLAFRANHFHLPEQWAIFIAAMVLIPAALYRLIEQPMIRLGRLLTSDPGPSANSALRHPAGDPALLELQNEVAVSQTVQAMGN